MRNRAPYAVGADSSTSPTPSTRPVNIPLHEDVWPERDGPRLEQSLWRNLAAVEKLHRARSKSRRRHIEAHVIHDPLGPCRLVNRGAPFEQERTHAARAQRAQARFDSAIGRENFGPACFEVAAA